MRLDVHSLHLVSRWQTDRDTRPVRVVYCGTRHPSLLATRTIPAADRTLRSAAISATPLGRRLGSERLVLDVPRPSMTTPRARAA